MEYLSQERARLTFHAFTNILCTILNSYKYKPENQIQFQNMKGLIFFRKRRSQGLKESAQC